MKLFGNVLMRIVATFVASALGVIGAGSVAGSLSGVQIPMWFSAVMGGVMAVAKVVELLSLAFLEDGKLSRAEIDAAFRQTIALKDVKDDAEPAPKATTSKKTKVAVHDHNETDCETCGK
jgi:hypothetical protein